MDREPDLKSQHYEQKYYKPIWSAVPPFIPPLLFFSFSSRQRLLRQFRHDGIDSPQKLEVKTVRKALWMIVFVSHCYSRCVCVCVYQRDGERERGCPGVVTCCGAHLFIPSFPPSLHPPPPPHYCLWCFSVTLC